MPNEMPKEIIDSNNQSSSENLKKQPWVNKQTEEALNKLGTDTEKKFYEEDSEKKVVTYKIEVVKQYLTTLYEKVKDIKNPREAWNKLVEEGNTSAWIMAVQIALESLGKEEYDVGKIDGIFRKGGTTEAAVKNFQRDNGLTPDGAPGRETIRVLLEKLGEQKGEKKEEEEEKDPLEDVKVKEGERELPEEDVKPEDLVEGLPDGATAEYEDGKGVDKEKEGEEQEVTVIVKVGDKVKKVVVIVEINDGKMKTREKKEEEKDPLEDVKGKEGERELPEEDVKPEDLVEGLPEGATAEYEDGKGVDKEKEGEEQEVTVIVKVGDKVKKVVVIVEINDGKMKTREKKEEEEKDPLEDVKVKEGERELPEEDVKPEDLVEGLPDGATAEYEDGKGVDKEKEGEEQEVTVIVKVGDKVKKVVVIVEINDGKMKTREKKEDENENKEVLPDNQYGNFEWKYLDAVENRSKVTITSVEELKDFLKISDSDENAFTDKKTELLEKYNEEYFKTRDLAFMYFVIPNTASPRYEIKSAERVGDQINVVYGDDGKDRGDIGAEVISSEILFVEVNKGENVNWIEETEVEKDSLEGVKVKDEIDLPEDGKEVEAKELLKGLPEGADVKYEDEKGIDKTKEGEVQQVTVIVTVGDKSKTIVVLATVEGDKIKLEDKEEKEKAEEMEWLKDLDIDDLGTWGEDGHFDFKDGLVDEETEKLIVNDKEIEKLGESGSGFAYVVENGRLIIGNFENGVLNGNGVEFNPYGDEYRTEGKDPNLNGIKCCGKWENGELKDGNETVREGGLNVNIDIENGEAVRCYVEDGELLSCDFEKVGDSLFLNKGVNSLKVKSKYAAVTIMKILYDYREQEGEFVVDMSEGLKSKKLLRKSSTGETKVVYWYADNLVESPIGAEGSALAVWLNDFRNFVEEDDEGEEEDDGEEKEAWVEALNLDEIGTYEDGKFSLKEGVEKPDEGGQMYIEVGGKRFYKDNGNGLCYEVGDDFFWIGRRENGDKVGYRVEYYGDGRKVEGNYNSEGNREGKWKMTTKDGKEGGGNYENGKKVGYRVEYYGEEKREGEYNSEGNREGKWKTDKDGREGGGNYENGKQVGYRVEYYEDGRKREGEYNSEGKEEGRWKITTKDGREGGGNYENGKQVGYRVDYRREEKREGEYNSEGNREGKWKTDKDGKEGGGNYENGKKVGYRVEYWDDKKREGNYNSEGNKEGEWKITKEDGTVETKKFNNGEEVSE